MNGVDALTHLDEPALAHRIDALVARSRQLGVGGWVIAAANPADWPRVITVARQIGAAPVLGIHPWWSDSATDSLARLPEQLTPHGIGEIGLDHLHAQSPAARKLQERVFVAQLRLAHDRNLPVILHCVRAWHRMAAILMTEQLPSAGGMIHGWIGNGKQANEAIRLGLHLSIGPTSCRSERTIDGLRSIPIERLLLESDCPTSPSGAEPCDLLSIAGEVAHAIGIPAGKILSRTGENARSLFRYPLTKGRGSE